MRRSSSESVDKFCLAAARGILIVKEYGGEIGSTECWLAYMGR